MKSLEYFYSMNSVDKNDIKKNEVKNGVDKNENKNNIKKYTVDKNEDKKSNSISTNIPTKKAMPIFSQKLAGWLMQKGFVLKRIDKNYNNNNYHVFIFRDTKEIKKAIKKYQKSVK